MSTSDRTWIRRLVGLRPAPQRYRTAAIAAVCTAVPLFAAGPALGALGSFGALAALYGRPSPPARDAFAVAVATGALAVGFLVGSTAAGRPWLAIPVVAVWAAAVTVVVGTFEARPPGMVMPVLVAAVAAGLPPRDPFAPAVAIAAVGLLATVLIWLSAHVRRSRSPVPRRPAAHARTPVWAGLRTAFGVALGGALAYAVGSSHPYWAMITAAAVLGTGNQSSIAMDRALARGAGTAVGCLVAGAVLALRPEHLVEVCLIALFTFGTECVVARSYALAMLFVTPTAVLLGALASPVPPAPVALAGDRLLQTALGCAGAVVAGQLVTVRWAVRHRLHAITAVLVAAADLLDEPPGVASGSADSLAARLRHLQLVTARTAGERRSVRAAVAELDEIVRWTTAIAQSASQSHDGARAAALRRTAAALEDGAVPELADVDSAQEMVGLVASVTRWLARRASCGNRSGRLLHEESVF